MIAADLTTALVRIIHEPPTATADMAVPPCDDPVARPPRLKPRDPPATARQERAGAGRARMAGVVAGRQAHHHSLATPVRE